MWSKKPMPVASLACPLPSSATRTRICVSLVMRSTSAWRGAAALRAGLVERGAAARLELARARGCVLISEARFQGIDHRVVLLRCAHSDAQAVGQQRMRQRRADVLDQHAAGLHAV